jgi:hypothetical protein
VSIAAETRQVSLRVLADEVRASVPDAPAMARAMGVSETSVYRALRDPKKHVAAFVLVARVLGWEPDPNVEGLYRRVQK